MSGSGKGVGSCTQGDWAAVYIEVDAESLAMRSPTLSLAQRNRNKAR